MIEIRFHGRGGQGVVAASHILGESAFKEGKYIQSFPFFGVERRGAPVMAFLRISDENIRIKTQIYNPDYVIVMDSTLLKFVDVFNGIKKNGVILINTHKKPSAIKSPKNISLFTINATDIAVEFGLGSKTTPIVNTAILGAFVKISEVVDLKNLLNSINDMIKIKTLENINAAKKAYEKTST